MVSMRLAGSIILVFGALFLGGTERAQAVGKQVCSLRSIEGSYGYLVNGANVGGGPVAAAGRFTANGRGQLTSTETTSVNGLVLRRNISGSYSLNPDCTGSVTFTDNFGQTTHLDFVVVQDREEIQFIQTDAGAVTTGVAKKQ